MHGIEGVESVLKDFTAFSFFAVIKPYRNKSENGESLNCKFKCLSEKLNDDVLSFGENKVEQNH